MRAERAAWGFILLTKLGGCALPYVTVFSHPTITVPRLIYIIIYIGCLDHGWVRCRPKVHIVLPNQFCVRIPYSGKFSNGANFRMHLPHSKIWTCENLHYAWSTHARERSYEILAYENKKFQLSG